MFVSITDVPTTKRIVQIFGNLFRNAVDSQHTCRRAHTAHTSHASHRIDDRHHYSSSNVRRCSLGVHIVRRLFKLRSHLWHFSGRSTSTLKLLLVRHCKFQCAWGNGTSTPLLQTVTYTIVRLFGDERRSRPASTDGVPHSSCALHSTCVLCTVLSMHSPNW